MTAEEEKEAERVTTVAAYSKINIFDYKICQRNVFNTDSGNAGS